MKKKDSPDNQASNTPEPSPIERVKEYQWKPGQSGNLAGRPPDGLSLTSKMKELYTLAAPTALIEQLRQVKAIPDEWEKDGRTITWLEAQVLRNAVKASNTKFGDVMAKEVWDRFDGKVPVRVAGPDGGPVKIQTMDLKKLSATELRQMRELMLKAAVEESEESEKT